MTSGEAKSKPKRRICENPSGKGQDGGRNEARSRPIEAGRGKIEAGKTQRSLIVDVVFGGSKRHPPTGTPLEKVVGEAPHLF